MTAEHEMGEKLTPLPTTLSLFRLSDKRFLEVANYFLTELPHRKADFDKKLQIAIQEISPSIEK